MTNISGAKHYLLHSVPSWGHAKPMVALAIFIVQARQNVCLTFIVNNILYSKVVAELSKRSEGKAIPPGRINVVDAFEPSTGNPMAPLDFDPVFRTLLRAEPLLCKSSGTVFRDLPPVTVAVIDPFASYVLPAIRAEAGDEFPVLAWMTAPAAPYLCNYGPEKLGGLGELGAKIDAEVAKTGGDRLKIGQELLDGAMGTGKVLEVPGLPPMYDYELSPQVNVVGPLAALIVQFVSSFVHGANGMLIVSSSAYEGKALEALREWLASTGKSLFVVGPLAFPDTISKDPVPSSGAKDVVPFLDRMQHEFGPNSVIYISFGTFFWPSDPTRLWAFLDELISQRTPFVFAHPSPLAVVPEDIQTKIAGSGIAIAMPWAPQDLILSHPAIGWFVTHGGWNSIQESFAHKVPLIVWPFGSDQPVNAAVLTLDHKASFELIEVRAGELGMRKPFRTGDGPAPTFTADAVRAELRGLLGQLKGEEGVIVRKNAEALGEKMSKTWNEDGEARQELNRFLDTY